MKKIFLFALTIGSIIGLSFIYPTSDFEGKITYAISIEGDNVPQQAKSMMEGSEINVYIKGNKSRSEANMGFQHTTTIADRDTHTYVILMEIMGKKYKIKSNPDSSKEKDADVSVKYMNDTKEIAGYKCKRADVTFKSKSGNDIVSSVYYTEDIPNYIGNDQHNFEFKGIKGMPLEYEMNAGNGMKMKMSAKVVSKESVPDSKFEIPADYKETTAEEIMKETMKQMQNGGQH